MCELPTSKPRKGYRRSLAALLLGLFVILGLAACGGSGGGSDTAATPPPGTNTAPVAVAGGNQSVSTGVAVALNGSASSDQDGNTLSYSWSLTGKPAGSTASIVNASSVNASVTPDVDGNYTVRLVVNDGKVDSAASTMVVTSATGNRVPLANAGSDKSATTGAAVILDGSASSDPDGSPLTYAWSLASRPAGSAATVVSPTSVNASITPDVAGSYTVQLIVNDGSVNSAADTMVVTATMGNRPPVANAGPDQSVTTGAVVNLTGSASSDPDGNPLTYVWSLTSKPAGSTVSIVNPTSVNAAITPDVAGSYTIQLIVNDGTINSAADTMVVTASIANRPPTANAGPDQSVNTGAVVNLDGSASSDPDGNPLAYAWSLTSKPVGSAAAISSATSATASVTSDISGNYTVQLVVNDGIVASAADTMVVSATAPYRLKLADTGQINDYTSTFGEDSDYTINPPSYTNRDDGTIIDNVTGLIWQNVISDITLNLVNAVASCDTLDLATYSDWRLPSTMELMGINNYGILANGVINSAFYIPTIYYNDTYWTSDSSTPDLAIVVLLRNGNVGQGLKTNSGYTRCVRGGQ